LWGYWVGNEEIAVVCRDVKDPDGRHTLAMKHRRAAAIWHIYGTT
jgi:hypothetical protein